MTKLTLPRLNQTGANEWADVESNDVAIREVINGELDSENLKTAAGITRAQLVGEAKPVSWYTPKVIATEEGRTNTAFGTLTTADEISGVVVPENGLILVGYQARWKSSVAGAGRSALFLGANQLQKNEITAQAAVETSTPAGTNFVSLSSSANGGLEGTTAQTTFGTPATTGTLVGVGGTTGNGGMATIWAAAGTYAISVQFKATSGTVTAKERRLWVAVLGY